MKLLLLAAAISLLSIAPTERTEAATLKFKGVVTDTIFTEPGSPSYDGQFGLGKLSFKRSDVVFGPRGRGTVAGADLSLVFNFGGQTFMTGDDRDFPFLPSLTFSAKGRPIFLDFAVTEDPGAINTIAIDDPNLVTLRTLARVRLEKIGKEGWLVAMQATSRPDAVTEVPLPAGAGLLLTALVGLGLVGRARRRTS